MLENCNNNFNFSIQDLLDRDLSDYGVIAFIFHGNVYLNGSFVSSSSSSASSLGEVVLNTNEILTLGSIFQYMENLIRRELVIGRVGSGQNRAELAITPKFIRANSSNQTSNAIVYLGACSAMFNNSMAQAFQDIGAGAVLGYTRIVGDLWAQQHGTAMFRALSTGRRVSEVPGLFEVEGSASQARFVIAGGLSLTLVDKS